MNLDDVDWDEMTSTIMYGDDQLALSAFLHIPPFLLEEGSYSHYGLNIYEFDGDSYAVGDDADVEDAMYKYAENMIEYELDTMEEWWLNDYLYPLMTTQLINFVKRKQIIVWIICPKRK